MRADGNSEIGLGHVHRLIALAEILKKDFNCIFVIRRPLPRIKELIMECCASLIEIEHVTTLEQEADELLQDLTGNEIIVLDGYQFDTAYQKKIKQ